MTNTIIQKSFAPIKRFLPKPISNAIRSIMTAILTPVLFSVRTGHFKSSFLMKAVSKNGKPIPWYTYPCIDFLSNQSYKDKNILEFGSGQSSLWWANIAKKILSLEGDKKRFEMLRLQIPNNIDLHYVSIESSKQCVSDVNSILSNNNVQEFDIIIIDGLYRYEMIEIAMQHLADKGGIICDNSEGYGFYEGFADSKFRRVDFYGYVPGVVLPHCTSIFFNDNCFLFDNSNSISVIAID